MMRARHVLFILATALSALTALAQAPGPVPSGPVPSGACDRCGKIESIRTVTAKDQWTPLGSVVATSPLAGTNGSPSAVTMVKIESGPPRQSPVFIGAAGGAVYKTRPSELTAQRWEVSVRMDDGGTRLLTQNYEPMLHEGDRVRVMGTQLELVQ
jgi:outer membrane lipoprotein SlyB